MTRDLDQKGIEKAVRNFNEFEGTALSGAITAAVTAYLDATDGDPAPASGWRVVPVEPDEMQLVHMKDAFRTTRVSGVGGQTVDATFSRDHAREIAAYRAMIAAAPEPPVSDGQTQAARDVLAERQRQISAEGWTVERDDAVHANGELANAAACYAAGEFSDIWPWDESWWKPTTRRRDLIKAGALILAEIERLDRAAPPKNEQEARATIEAGAATAEGSGE